MEPSGRTRLWPVNLYIYIYKFIYIYIYIYIYFSLSRSLSLYIYIYISLSLYVYIFISLSLSLSVYIYMCVFVCVCVCVCFFFILFKSSFLSSSFSSYSENLTTKQKCVTIQLKFQLVLPRNFKPLTYPLDHHFLSTFTKSHHDFFLSVTFTLPLWQTGSITVTQFCQFFIVIHIFIIFFLSLSMQFIWKIDNNSKNNN